MISLFYFFIIVNNLDSIFAFTCRDRMTENLRGCKFVYDIKKRGREKQKERERVCEIT